LFQRKREKVGAFDYAYVLITPVRSGYIGALTKPKPSVSAKVEASLGMAAAMQHANTAPAFIAAWDNAPDDHARLALEQTALAHGTTAVKVEALLKRDARSRAEMATLQAALNTATAAVNTANANAAAAQAVAANASAFKPATPPIGEIWCTRT
jgi:autotransporter translocation and assembly factor TamB